MTNTITVQIRWNGVFHCLVFDCNRFESELIHEFVLKLPKATRDIGSAQADQDTNKIEEVVRQLKAHAASFGFDEITEYAQKIESKLIKNSTMEEVHDDARQLAKLCLQARSPVEIPEVEIPDVENQEVEIQNEAQ